MPRHKRPAATTFPRRDKAPAGRPTNRDQNAGRADGTGASRVEKRLPSSLTIVPPKTPQKRVVPTSTMPPTEPCGARSG